MACHKNNFIVLITLISYLNHIDQRVKGAIMKYGIFSLALLVLIPCFTASIMYARRKKTKKSSTLRVGDEAPKFTLSDEKSEQRSLVDYSGYKIAIYFYPKAGSLNCTKEACSIRDSYDALKRKNIVVLGISSDKPEKLKKFKQKYNLPFTLLSDRSKEVAKMYDASGGIFGLKRITYLIDENRKIVKIIKKVDVKNHWRQIIDGFNQTS